MVDSVGRAGPVRNRDGQRCWQDDFAVVPHMKLPLHTHLTASRYGDVKLQGESAAIFGQLQAGGLGVEGDGDVLRHPSKMIAGWFGHGSGLRRLTHLDHIQAGEIAAQFNLDGDVDCAPEL